jgi:hypothetical protein
MGLSRNGYSVLFSVMLALVLGPRGLGGQRQPAEPRFLPTLTTARQVHDLTREQAAQSYPVHLHVVVTYYDADNDRQRAACFASDSSGGIYIDLRSLPAVLFKAGDSVEIKG